MKLAAIFWFTFNRSLLLHYQSKHYQSKTTFESNDHKRIPKSSTKPNNTLSLLDQIRKIRVDGCYFLSSYSRACLVEERQKLKSGVVLPKPKKILKQAFKQSSRFQRNARKLLLEHMNEQKKDQPQTSKTFLHFPDTICCSFLFISCVFNMQIPLKN